MRNIFITTIALLSVFTTLEVANAKVYIDIDSPAGVKLPIAIQEFKVIVDERRLDDSLDAIDSHALTNSVVDTLYGDLRFTGLFDIIDKAAYLEDPASSSLTLRGTDFSDWRTIGAELLIKGAVSISGKRVTVEFRLFDTVKETQLIGRRYVGRGTDPRAIAHAFADDLMLEITGTRGIFSTRLIFVSDRTGTKEIYASDYDGRNLRPLTNNGSINLAPSWSPDGERLLYTSYVDDHPILFIQELRSGKAVSVPTAADVNIGGRWSPNGRDIALSISTPKSPELFILDPETKKRTQVTNNYSIDVSPSWSPDGESIVFVSNRGGNPHIYMIKLTNGVTKRVTYTGKYNTDPAWSPDGRYVAYTSAEKGKFNIWIIGSDGKGARRLTEVGSNTTPSWSPDGRYIIFGSKRDGEDGLYIMRSDGSALRKINTNGPASAPSWSPYLR